MAADADWIYWDEAAADARGPIGLQELAELARSGAIGAATNLRRSSEAGWRAAGEAMPELFLGAAAAAERAPAWSDTRPHPWRRYAARMFDALVVGSLAWWIVGLLFFASAPAQAAAFFAIFSVPGGQFLDFILTYLIVIPFNALAIGLTGLTIGKWIFGVRVLKDGAPPGFRRALRREFSVFFRGLGLAIPFASLFTLIDSFNKLKDERVTLWDKAQRLTVVQRRESRLATAGMWLAVVVFVLLRILMALPAARG